MAVKAGTSSQAATRGKFRAGSGSEAASSASWLSGGTGSAAGRPAGLWERQGMWQVGRGQALVMALACCLPFAFPSPDFPLNSPRSFITRHVAHLYIAPCCLAQVSTPGQCPICFLHTHLFNTILVFDVESIVGVYTGVGPWGHSLSLSDSKHVIGY